MAERLGRFGLVDPITVLVVDEIGSRPSGEQVIVARARLDPCAPTNRIRHGLTREDLVSALETVVP